MGVGAFLEPLVVIVLLFGGTWINRTAGSFPKRARRKSSNYYRANSPDSIESGLSTPTAKDGLLGSRPSSPFSSQCGHETWRKRRVGVLSRMWEVTSPNTAVFQDRILSRLLRKLPFLAECWYWALVYWTYQLGRAFTAVTLQEGTVDVARKHALKVIEIEQKLGLFWEVPIQQFFLGHPLLMKWTNWIYSFIHIPGTIAFLVGLYYYTITRNRFESQPGKPRGVMSGSPAGPLLYQARRRTLAVCNLFAFVVFTLWPCMPPRLLSDENVEGPEGKLGRSYGFIDTVHGVKGASSVWTENRFCNQYAAMPSLHFGYSLMIGVTIMTIPLPAHHRLPTRIRIGPFGVINIPSWHRLTCLTLGFAYPSIILAAIVATANHFILDALAGAIVCVLGWRFNKVLLNLIPLEDYFLWVVRIHKPEPSDIVGMSDIQGWIDDDEAK
ncbi:hypothetical protein BDW59DRAFT_147388 [Aspergillus cavernicola]|uniref:Inositolphosphotransferase Aur1/Ipt1 domain-containing protein n=1 Tax=Aspergillus cavernicola TaxID=176166 RepID=A0ABR4I9N3_9EURO